MTQTITSAGTSLKQVPAIFRLINQTMDRPEAFWAYIDDVLDVGGGKYDLFTDKLAGMGIRNHVLDPYNRSEEHNQRVKKLLLARPADIAICSNVLNVIREVGARNDVHKVIKMLTKEDGMVFFTVYEGDKSSRGRKTTKGWQWHRPTKNYERELKRHYHNVTVCSNKLIVCEGFK
jgi:hypothetical protein